MRFPAGSYLSASIHLQSNVGLFIDHGATIVAADASAGPYDEPEPNAWDKFQDFGHSHWHNALMWGEGVENVSITGPGRHVKALTARDVRFTVDKAYARPAFRFEDAAGVDLERIGVPRAARTVFTLRGVTDFLLRNSPGLPDMKRAMVEKESF